jgi:hypothetical protein
MNKNHLCLGAAAVVVFFIGASVVQRVSPTFLGHPLLTIRAMRSYPINTAMRSYQINTRVRIADSVGLTMQQYFARQGMRRNDIATIERYEVVTDSTGGAKLNPDLRQGSRLLRAVDPSFFEPEHLASQTGEPHTAEK